MPDRSNRFMFTALPLLAALLGGCGKDMTISSSLMLEPHSASTLKLYPENVREVEFDNRGKGMVSMTMIDAAQNPSVKVSIGSLGHYKGPAEGMQSLVLENISDQSATVDYTIHSKDGAGVEIELDENATQPAHP